MLSSNARVHFIGIGGIGMSALAQVLLSKGYIVTGSDMKPNDLTVLIENKGGRIFKGHSETNIEGAQVVVYSSSISGDNPELKAARARGLYIIHRGRLLAELMKEKVSIAVTGAHGKTTTATMISLIMVKAGLDPVCILGGQSDALSGNARAGKGKWLVAEADESDGSHLLLEPKYGIITNIDREHFDYYKDMNHIIKANRAFLDRIKPGGAFFGLIDDERIRRMLLNYDGKFATFGMSPEADLYAENVVMDRLQTRFDCVYKKERIGVLRLNVPGRHNVLNALASAVFTLHIGVDFDIIAEALSGFRLSKRRFEIHHSADGFTLIEDYAHHPAEISATLEACRLLKPERVIAVFQPHRFTRTRGLAKEFGACFSMCDELILTNIYAASEEAIEGVSVKNIYDEAVKNGLKNAHIIPKENIANYIYNNFRGGDLVAVLGAGDIGDVAKDLGKRLKK